MPELDNRLETCLAELEAGNDLDQVLAGLPPESYELVPLIRMAAELRALPHPAPQEGQRAPLWRSAFQPTRPRPSNQPVKPTWTRHQLVFAGGLVGAALVAVMMFVVAVFAAGLWWAGPRQARAATLVELSGAVEVAPAESQQWVAVENGDQIRDGQRLRTGPQGSATLVFYDGSRANLGPQTELVIEHLSGGWGGKLQVALRQTAGLSNHSVVPFRTPRSSYQVETAAGTAVVHGTVFQVAVDPLGRARFAVQRGEVQVEGEDQSVLLAAGQATTAERGSAPADPAYQFALQGQLVQLPDGSWEVNGVSFQAALQAVPTDSGSQELVRVAGRLLSDGQLVADQVAPADETTGDASFTGELRFKNGDTWLVDDTQVLVNELTELVGNLEVGTPVEVEFTVLPDGRWQALKITALTGEEPPLETQEPGEIAVTETVTPTLRTDCTGAQPHPTGQRLADRYGVPYEEIMGWFCQRFGFGEIEHAYELSRQTGLPVEDIFALRRSGLGWGQVRARLAGITPTLTTTLTTTITATATITATPPISATEVPTATTTPEPPALETACTGANPHPTGMTLAARFGVPYEEIMGWFCQGYGFGEIDLAYGLSLQYGTPVADIFALRASGMGWGQIKRSLPINPVDPADSTDLYIPTNPHKPPKPTKPPKPPKIK